MTGLYPFMGLEIFIIPLLHLAIAYLVYKDAMDKGENGFLWAVLTLLPLVGLLLLIAYLVSRSGNPAIAGLDEEDTSTDDRKET
jgi:hypothetical protein